MRRRIWLLVPYCLLGAAFQAHGARSLSREEQEELARRGLKVWYVLRVRGVEEVFEDPSEWPFERFFAARYGSLETEGSEPAPKDRSLEIRLLGGEETARIRLAADRKVIEQRCREDLDCCFAIVPPGVGYVEEYYLLVAMIWRRLVTKASLPKMAEYMRRCYHIKQEGVEKWCSENYYLDWIWREISEAYLELWWPEASEAERAAVMVSSLSEDGQVLFHNLHIDERIASLGAEVARAPVYNVIFSGRLREDVVMAFMDEDAFKPTRAEIDEMLRSGIEQVSEMGKGFICVYFPNDPLSQHLLLAELASDQFSRVYGAVPRICLRLDRLDVEPPVKERLFRALDDRLGQIEEGLNAGRVVVGKDEKEAIDIVAMAVSSFLNTRYAAGRAGEVERHIDWLERAIQALSKRQPLSPDYLDWPNQLRKRLRAAPRN